QPLAIRRGELLAAHDPARQVAQLHVEERGLQVVEQAREAVAVILPRRAVFAVEAHAPRELRDFGIVGRDGTAVAVAAEDLERIEAPAARRPPRTRAAAVNARAQALA